MDGWEIAGMVGEIVGALGTVAAVAVALVGTKHARKAQAKAEAELAHERAHAANAAESAELAARRAQAEKVLAWSSHVATNAMLSDRGWVIDESNGLPVVRIANFSDAPVFDVVVMAQAFNGKSAECWRATALEPTSEARIADTLMDFEPLDGPVHAWMTFRDLAGRTWKRYQSGELVETTFTDQS